MAETKTTATKTGKGAGKTGRTWQRTPPPEHTPSTQEWIDIARRTLIEDGIVGVKIDRLAKTVFDSLRRLHDDLGQRDAPPPVHEVSRHDQ